jgi:hypothetical protein
VSGLGHFIEREGVPTAGISLVREHTESVRPPRALSVPFDFGHPFGAPGDSALQQRVLLALLRLFERDQGPVHEIFPDEIGPDAAHGVATPWSCPLPLTETRTDNDPGGDRYLEFVVQDELRALLPWYEHAAAERRRTTVGASGIQIPLLVPFIAGFMNTPFPDNPNEALSLPLALKAAVEDLKQVYLEAVSARPDASATNNRQLNDWFWRETRAAELLRTVAKSAQESNDKMLCVVAGMLIVPAAYSE